jgi:hypothetical protein
MITTNATTNWPVTTKTISTPLSGVVTTAIYTNSTELYFTGHVNSFNKLNNFTGTTPSRSFVSNIVPGGQTDGAMCHQAAASTSPAAIADTSTAAYNTAQTIQTLVNDEPSFLGGSFTTPGVATPSVKLCLSGETAPACTGTSLAVSGQGNYSVVPATGVVTFTPLNTFSGIATADWGSRDSDDHPNCWITSCTRSSERQELGPVRY